MVLVGRPLPAVCLGAALARLPRPHPHFGIAERAGWRTLRIIEYVPPKRALWTRRNCLVLFEGHYRVWHVRVAAVRRWATREQALADHYRGNTRVPPGLIVDPGAIVAVGFRGFGPAGDGKYFRFIHKTPISQNSSSALPMASITLHRDGWRVQVCARPSGFPVSGQARSGAVGAQRVSVRRG